MLEESLSGINPTRRPDSKFSSSKDGGHSSGGGKGGHVTAAVGEQQQQGVVNTGGVNVPGVTAEGAGGEGSALDEGVFEILTVSAGKWMSPDLPPEAGKQQIDNHSAASAIGGSSSSSSRPGVGPQGAHVGRHTGVSLTPQQLAGLHRVSQRRAN